MAEISVLRFARKIWTDSSTAAFVLIFVSFPMMLIWLLFAPQEKRVASAPEIVSVVDRLGERIGWWDISYPASLRKGDHEPITVTYKADPRIGAAEEDRAGSLFRCKGKTSIYRLRTTIISLFRSSKIIHIYGK